MGALQALQHMAMGPDLQEVTCIFIKGLLLARRLCLSMTARLPKAVRRKPVHRNSWTDRAGF